MERVQFIVILHTEMGNADVVSNFLDEVAYPEVVVQWSVRIRLL